MLSANQLHGTRIYCRKEPLHEDLEVGVTSGCDGLITNQRGIGLMIQHADCQAVLLYDPEMGVIAALHCGWRGSVQGILSRGISLMASEFGCQAHDIHAVIGPSLGPCCAEFIHYQKELPEGFLPFMVSDNSFDFWQISHSQLTGQGLLAENIAAIGICTVCSPEYFSYRRARRQTAGITGRNCSLIQLEPGA